MLWPSRFTFFSLQYRWLHAKRCAFHPVATLLSITHTSLLQILLSIYPAALLFFVWVNGSPHAVSRFQEYPWRQRNHTSEILCLTITILNSPCSSSGSHTRPSTSKQDDFSKGSKSLAAMRQSNRGVTLVTLLEAFSNRYACSSGKLCQQQTDTTPDLPHLWQ